MRVSSEGIEGFSVASVALRCMEALLFWYALKVCFYAKCDIALGEELLPFGQGKVAPCAFKDLLWQELVELPGHSRCHRGTADATASSPRQGARRRQKSRKHRKALCFEPEAQDALLDVLQVWRQDLTRV